MGRPSLVSRAAAALLLVVLAAPLLLIAGLVAPVVAATGPGAWQSTAGLGHARTLPGAVRLGDGSVLVAGGFDGDSFLGSAERWNPSSGAWASAASLPVATSGQVALPLPGGRALFAAGTGELDYYRRAAVFDPATGGWTETGSIGHAHAYGAGAVLAGGDVLVVGGYDGSAASGSAHADVYGAVSGAWSAVPDAPGPGRVAPTATSLGDGRVLVAGGDAGSLAGASATASAAIYDRSAGWSLAASMTRPRFDHAAVRLADGRVLVAGGTDASGVASASAELYDPVAGSWTATGAMIYARFGLGLTLLADGRVLAAGGYPRLGSPALASAELYDPATGAWSLTGPLLGGRAFQAAVLVADGRVLEAGGEASPGTALASAETYVEQSASLLRLGGPDRFATAAVVSQNTFPTPGVAAAYIAYAYNFPDALAGAAAAGSVRGPVLLVATAGPLNDATARELSRLRPKSIVVLGSAGVVSDAVFDALKAYAPSVVRYGGASRFETAVAVSQHTWPNPTTTTPVDAVYIAYAYNFPDALAGAAAAGTVRGPVLLVDTPAPINPATSQELSRLRPKKIVVLGSAGVVSDAVLTQLRAYSPNVVRFAGPSRFETAAAVSFNTWPSTAIPVDTAYVAYAYNFPDALAGAAAAGTARGPVLLAATSGPVNAATTNELARLKPKRIVVLGSEGVVSAAVLAQLLPYVPAGP